MNILNFFGRGFDIETEANINLQIIKILKDILHKNIIHNDIKPSNMCWGKFINSEFNNASNIFLIDFGYSKILLNN
jgi:thiamine kinase-like enzyme